MRAEVLLALNRSVASCCSTGKVSLQRLLSSMAQEIVLMVAPEITGVAVIAAAPGERPLVGQARDGVSLSEEALVWLTESCRGVVRSLVVKDHTFEPLTYSGSAPKSSVVVRLTGQLPYLTQHRVQLWFGCDSTVTSRLVERLQRLSAGVSEWFDSSAQTIEMVLEASSCKQELESYRREVLCSVHDIRAVLGALRYRRSLEEQGEEGGDGSAADLSYIESLLSRLGPRGQIKGDCRKAPANGLSQQGGVRPEVLKGELHQTGCCCVGEVVRRVVERWRASAAHVDIQFYVDPEGINTQATIESIELERALTNIIGNAVKHSKGSEIAIEAQRAGGDLVLVVRDNGEGFPEEVLISLCGGAARLRSSGDGWGIGLISARDRIKAAGGSMVVSSPAGGGSAVTLTLPIPSYATDYHSSALELRELSSYGSHARQQGEIFLVDDDEEHTASLGRALSRYGVFTRSFSSIDAAAQELTQSNVSPIVCDINMPDGGAEKLLTQVRSAKCSAPIAIMSGESDDVRLYRLAGVGAQAFFCKPVEIEALVEWALACSCRVEKEAP